MEFPRWVFTSPGDIKLPDKSYGQQIVNDEDEYKAALAAGFYSTVPEALDAVSKTEEPKTIEKPKEDEKALLTAKAKSLGIEVDNRWGINRLNEEIKKAVSNGV